ncbi:MAG: SCO family protein, partial [Proteobacteria bacterium]|nr:SCO family protein [Pseudomonadota bacterium]
MTTMTRSVFLPFISFFLLLTLGASTTLAKPRYNRTVEEYKIPDITLINQDGEKVRLVEYLDTGKPVILEFIFATCTTI